MSIALDSNAQSADSLQIRAIVNEIMAHGEAYDHLRQLCAGGSRLSGSPGAEKAVQITHAMLKKSGAARTWLQPCMVPQWIRGQSESASVLSGGKERKLRVTSLGNSRGRGMQPVCASLVEVTDYQAFLQWPVEKVKGKIVFFNLPMNPTHIRSFQAYGESGIARRAGPADAAAKGALGVLTRSLASNRDPYPHTGATRYPDSLPPMPAMALSTEDADWLQEELKKTETVRICMQNESRFGPDVLSHNVIGEIRGSEYPDEIITVGGHLDSWDLGEGAHDDGAGCVQSIEIIRAFQALGIRPKRTIRVVLFMNEENGGKGGQAYLDSAKLSAERFIFALESDAGGFSPRGFGFDVSDSLFQKINRWSHLFQEYGAAEWVRGGGGSDIAPLKSINTALAGLMPDSQRYFDVHHAETDVFSTVSRRELHLGASVMAALVWLVSEYGL